MDILFAPVKGDEDHHTFIVNGNNHYVIGYYSKSWARLGGMMYRYSDIGMRIRATTRKEIERLITKHLEQIRENA